MHEDAKLAEAAYFLTQMIANEDDPRTFAHNLSAFLSAARSVTQYAREEAKGKPDGLSWYDGQVARDRRPVVGFLKDQRDISVHMKPVGPGRSIYVAAVTTLHLSGSDAGSGTSPDTEGRPVEIRTPAAPPGPPTDPHRATPPSVRYEFEGWAGPEDIPTLCHKYLSQLREIVADGRARGLLTS